MKCVKEIRDQNESEIHSVMSDSLQPIDYTVHEILQARTLEIQNTDSPGESSQPRDQTQVSCTACGLFTSWATKEALVIKR